MKSTVECHAFLQGPLPPLAPSAHLCSNGSVLARPILRHLLDEHLVPYFSLTAVLVVCHSTSNLGTGVFSLRERIRLWLCSVCGHIPRAYTPAWLFVPDLTLLREYRAMLLLLQFLFSVPSVAPGAVIAGGYALVRSLQARGLPTHQAADIDIFVWCEDSALRLKDKLQADVVHTLGLRMRSKATIYSSRMSDSDGDGDPMANADTGHGQVGVSNEASLGDQSLLMFFF